MEGILYEPRSLWTVRTVVGTSVEQRVPFDRRHFFNGEKWPITITRITVAPINYTLMGEIPAKVGESLSTAQILNRIGLSFSVPQRLHMNKRRRITAATIGHEPTQMPPQDLAVILPAPFSAEEYIPSSLYGQCNLAFDHPLVLPKNGAIEFDLSAHTSPFAGETPIAVQSRATMLWQERGGLFAGSGRGRTVPLFIYTGQALPGIEDWPYAPDPFAGGPAAAAVATANWWDGRSRFPAGGSVPDAFGNRDTTFGAQEATRSGSTEIIGFRTFIDQILEDQYTDTEIDNVASCPLSLRTGCRVRCTSGGSAGHWWWRPGAPLALVLDSITPASVLKLEEPITLLPGEQLDGEVIVPANLLDQETTFRIGVAFNGYATIEG